MVVYNAVFSVLFVCLDQRKADLLCGEVYFDGQHTVAAIEGHEVALFKVWIFYGMPSQNKTKNITKLLMAKKARIRAWREKEATVK
jgi:hypothetical protein